MVDLEFWKDARIKFPVLFVFKIVLFGLLYWVAFAVSPDSFRFSEGYNVTPLSRYAARFYETDDLSEISEGDVNNDVADLQLTAKILDDAYEKAERLKAEKDVLDEEHHALMEEMNVKAIAAVDEYKLRYIDPLDVRILEMERRAGSLAKGDPETVLLMKQIVKMSEEILNHHNRILQDHQSFIPDHLLQKEIALSKKLEIAWTDYKKAEGEFRQMRSKLAGKFSRPISQ